MIKFLSSSKSVSLVNQVRAKKALDVFLKRKDIGFHHLPDREELWTSAENLGRELRMQYSDLVVVGIGGSSLGAKAIYEIFASPLSAHRVHFCDNVDATEFDRLVNSIPNLEQTAWLFISKSGSTIETLLTIDFVHQIYTEKGFHFFNHIYIITEKKDNPLALLAKKHNRPALEIPLDVGGRFSVLTPVGMVPAAFLGLSPFDFREGAKEILAHVEPVESMVAYVLDSFERNEWITLFWFYSSWMRSFSGWIQQLWAESLAKQNDRTGSAAPRASTPMGAIGACDQHSILQQVMDGYKDKFVVFLRVQSAEQGSKKLKQTLFEQHKFLQGYSMGDLLAAEAQATSQALSQADTSNLVLSVIDLSPKSVGGLFMYWQLVVATLGEAMNINAFDQPGVELGKRLAKEIIKG